MKRMNYLLAALMSLLLLSITSCDDRPITVDQLPAAAKTLVQQHFPDLTVIYAEKDFEILGSKYDARLSDGTEIGFNSKGDWTKVDRNLEAVPAVLIPEVIANYVGTSFAGASITKIEKTRRGYEVELSNGLEIKFATDGRVLELDD